MRGEAGPAYRHDARGESLAHRLFEIQLQTKAWPSFDQFITEISPSFDAELVLIIARQEP